jgi:hypothetical protein
VAYSGRCLTEVLVRAALGMGLESGPSLARHSYCKFQTNQLLIIELISLLGDILPQRTGYAKTQKPGIDTVAVEYVSAWEYPDMFFVKEIFCANRAASWFML